MARAAKIEAEHGSNSGRKLDQSHGFNSRDEYGAHLEAMAKTGKLNRHARRAFAAAERDRKREAKRNSGA